MMMHAFLTANREELIARCRAKVALRSMADVPEQEMANGVTVFLGQLIKTLEMEDTPQAMSSHEVSGPANGRDPALSEIGESATLHGKELMQGGFTVDDVVREYGDLCQAISGLAVETGTEIGADEFRTLNRCLDNAIASAVTEYGYQRELANADKESAALNERLGFFAHELRNHLCTATLALSIIKAGNVGLSGATGGVLDRALVGMSDLIARSLADVRLSAGMEVSRSLFSLADLIAQVRLSASLEAQVKQCVLRVPPVDPLLAIEGDRDLVLSAVSNLLQNAFKFSHSKAEVNLSAYAVAHRILIDVEDRCGGLPTGQAEKMFLPFSQGSEDKSGLGLGLSIARRSVEANDGLLTVRDVPGKGCVFTLDFPRHLLPVEAPVAGYGEAD